MRRALSLGGGRALGGLANATADGTHGGVDMIRLDTASVAIALVCGTAGTSLALGGGCASPSGPLAEPQHAAEALRSTAEQRAVRDTAPETPDAADTEPEDADTERESGDREGDDREGGEPQHRDREIDIDIDINIDVGGRQRDEDSDDD